MTGILIKLFVKDSDNINNHSVRTSYGLLSSVVGIISNVILFVFKFILGMIINSIAITADAFNNLSDAISSVIGFIGVKLAAKPADKEHPFGHGRYEYIAALIVSFLIIEVGWTTFKGSFDKILNPSQLNTSSNHIIFLVISILIKVWLVVFNKQIDKKINSTVIRATAIDSLGDVVITSIMVVSIIVSKLSNIIIDGYMGLLVSIFVIISGINIARTTLMPLIGEAIDAELYKKIKNMVESYDGVVGTHDLIIHSYGPTSHMATIHVEVPDNSDIKEIHEIVDEIERDILDKTGICIVIHTDPIEVNDEKVLMKKEKIEKIVKSLEPFTSIHDFRVVSEEENINIIFEVVIPYSYSEEDEKKLLLNLTDEVKRLDSKYQCVVSFEKSFVAEN
ncbi:MAG TPA: cation transporter [Clostridiales bacterium]|nr:cation transporter [Clostridiales bacterium]